MKQTPWLCTLLMTLMSTPTFSQEKSNIVVILADDRAESINLFDERPDAAEELATEPNWSGKARSTTQDTTKHTKRKTVK